MSRHYDVIIIGTGAGGGTLAYHLPPSGNNILLPERGDYVPHGPVEENEVKHSMKLRIPQTELAGVNS